MERSIRTDIPKHLAAAALVLICSGTLGAQKLKYGGMQQIGLLFGEQIRYSLNLTNGVRFQNFFTGIGISAEPGQLDYYWSYTFPTVSVYVDGRYYLNKKKNFFVKVCGGSNFISRKFENGTTQLYTTFPGFMTSAGLGFKARIGKEIFYSFDLNYHLKQTRYNYSFIDFRGIEVTEKYDMRQYRICFNFGIEIF